MTTTDTPELTPALEALLQRYLQIQEEERTLQEEKKALQNDLKKALAGMQQRFWFTEVGGTALKISCSTNEQIDYDDDLLRQRLGNRLRLVSSPDIRKIRSNLSQVEALLEPALDLIGSVDRIKVKHAVEQGLVRTEEFAGAFTRQKVTRVAVMRQRAAEDNAPA